MKGLTVHSVSDQSVYAVRGFQEKKALVIISMQGTPGFSSTVMVCQ